MLQEKPLPSKAAPLGRILKPALLTNSNRSAKP
jgi:hypothetical protein